MSDGTKKWNQSTPIPGTSAFADEGSAVAPEGVDEPAIAVEAERAGLSLLGSSHTKAKSLGMHEA